MRSGKLLSLVLSGKTLSTEEAFDLMGLVIGDDVTQEQISAILACLRLRGESVSEIVGFVKKLRTHAKVVDIKFDNLIDVCGTGGDGLGTFNVSTTVAFVAAAAGAKVSKHGNRSVSSRSGSFDVLESLHVPFVEENEAIKKSLAQNNLAFLFAPHFHPSLKKLSSLRKNLGFYTIFNLLGPILNPLPIKRQMMGVYSVTLIQKVAEVFKELGAEDVIVVHGRDGSDEFSITGPSDYAHLKNGKINLLTLNPEDLGLKTATLEDIKGGDSKENARIVEEILAGIKGPKANLVILNSAGALMVAGVVKNLDDGVDLATSAITSGAALKLLNRIRDEK